MRRIGLFGGGRWSRVLLSVLQQVCPHGTEFLWFTRHNRDSAQRWLNEQKYLNVTVTENLRDDPLWAAIVATAPRDHSRQVEECLSRNIPTLCEKPLTLSYTSAMTLAKLSSQRNIPLGVNLVFQYASYLKDFAALLNGLKIESIDIDWLDIPIEVRHGETKTGDFYTPITHDMYPHCWSLLTALLPKHPMTKVKKVSYLPNSDVVIGGELGSMITNFRLSRRHQARVRRISVNHGEAILDFSTEPGIATINGKPHPLLWRGDRPLSASIKEFFKVVESGKQEHWISSIQNTLPSLLLAERASEFLDKAHEEALSLFRDKFGPDSAPYRHLVIDCLGPKLAAAGKRMPLLTPADLEAFFKEADALRQLS